MDLDTSPSELNAAERQAAQTARREVRRLRAQSLKRLGWTGMLVAVNLVAAGAVVALFAAPAGAAVIISGLVLLVATAFWLGSRARRGHTDNPATVPSCEADTHPASTVPMAIEAAEPAATPAPAEPRD